MQLFSQKKALAVLSLGALFALGACGDDVTVAAPAVAPVVISITPPSANMNIGESVNLAVQITGGTSPTLASCTSSNSAVATAAVQGTAACRVTAVASGNVTVTAAASTGNSAAAAINVAPASAAISNLTTSPTAAQVAVGQKVTIVPNVSRAASSVAVAYTYSSSSSLIASVASTGEVTAVAPGTATIVVTAVGSATGFTTATLTAGVTVTVTTAPAGINSLNVQPASLAMAVGNTAQLAASATQPAGAAAAVITYGTTAPSVANVSTGGLVTAVAPGTAVITVTATSPANANFSASTLTQLVPVTVAPSAQVIINSLTDNGATIDITNVAGQFEVNLSLLPNGQNVQSVQAFVCNQGEAQSVCIARGPAAQQTFGGAGGQAGFVQLYINSAEFTTPNFTTGADANTLFKNGLKTIVATLTTIPGNSAVNASNNLSQINFNNQDGWTISWTQPTNRANDAAGITWYGGPSTPDALAPGTTSGTGSFTVVPVLYSENRTIASAMIVINNGMACGSAINMTARPFTATYGTNARSATTAPFNFNCTGAASNTAGYVPSVASSVDNNNAAGPVQTGGDGAGAPAAATSIFTPISAAASGNPSFQGRYRQSLTYRPSTIYIPGDYLAPAITALDVRGGAGSGVDSAWVNGVYGIAQISAATGLPTRYLANDANVGLMGTTTSGRNTVFNVCAATTFSGTAATNCTSGIIGTGGITATIASMGIPESLLDFTNGAYFVQAIETDRLGNRATSVPSTWTSATVTPGISTSAVRPAQFGVDLTPPVLVAIPNTGGTSTPNYARTDVDSIYSALQNTYGTTNNANAVFGIRYTDTRSGFFTCTTLNCQTQANRTRGGTYQITRRSAPSAVSVLNDATVTNLVSTTGSILSAIDAPAGTNSGDATIREFYPAIFGDNTRGTSAVNPTILASQAGYYTFSGTLADRAGNSTLIPARSVAIDNANPQVTGITVPAVLAGGTSVSFGPTGTDDLEAIAGDLSLNYPQLSVAIGSDAAAVVGQPSSMRFRRVPHFTASAVLGFWHNPFASVTDNKLTTPIGVGTSLASAPLVVPIPFIQNIVTVDGADAPLTTANSFARFGTATDPRPNGVSAWLYDIRGASSVAWAGAGRSTALSATIFGGQISTPSNAATTKNWTSTGAGIDMWSAFNPVGGSIEFRAMTSSSITNPPFTSVSIVRQVGATEWEYLGEAVSQGALDQGASRFWRYTLAFAGINQGAGVTMAALTSGDVVRAIGVDASGNGLSSRSTTIGVGPLPPALPASVTVTNTAMVAITNASAPQPITVGVSSNPNTANLIFSCSSNSSFVTASMTGPTTCTLSPNGVVASNINVTITYSATGSASGFSTNTVSNGVVVQRTP